MSPVTRQSQSFRIYALVDPRTNEARYVGQTAETLNKRLMTHCNEAHRKSTDKNQWIQELKALDQLPEIRLLEQVQGRRKDAYESETRWIRQLRLDGHRLLNHPIPTEFR